jgi:signal peptidase I
VKAVVRPLALFTAIASVLAVAATAYWSQRWNVVTIAMLAALTWSALLATIDVFSGPPPLEPDRDPEGRAVPVTYVMRLGEERLDIARTSLLLAAQAGPVVVVATRHHEFLDDLGSVEVRECVAPTIAEALQDATRGVSTEAVLVLSASAFPLGRACGLAAAQLTDGVGWVTGTAPAFNNDRYAPGERELIGTRVRAAGRAHGLESWEPDATIVRTSLLGEHPLEAGRPDGAWLRDRVADGWQGAVSSEPIAVRAAPADAPVFWPTQTKRRRGAVADLADALTRGPFRARAVALGGLLRELYAYPLLLWLLAIVAIGRTGSFPLAVSAGAFFALQAALGLVRWMSSRLAFGVGLHPVDEAREAAYDVPGSLLALPSAVTRRVRPVRFDIPDQPLLWMALVVTLLTTIPLLDRKTVTNNTVGVAVGLALAALAATWVFALRAFGSRGWDRASYRLAVDHPATINGDDVSTVDASPSGLGIVGARAPLARGAAVALTVTFDSKTVSLRGHVTDVRPERGGEGYEVGVALDLTANERAAWIRELFAPTVLTEQVAVPIASRARPRRIFNAGELPLRRRLIAALQVVAVTGVSVLVLGALLLALLGYRPMVVRSGSMVPTLGIGDVVIANWVHVDRIHPGEIVTFPADIDRPQLITHRVQKVVVGRDFVHVQTKGDANAEPEEWSQPRNALVGHVYWRIPKIGRLLVVLGESTTKWFLLAATTSVVLIAVVMRSLRRRRSRAGRLAISPG